MLLPLLMNLGMFAGGPAPPPAAEPERFSGGYFDRGPTRQARREHIRRERVRYGIIPDDVPAKAVEVIEEAVATQLTALEYDEAVQREALRQMFHVERLRWRDAYEGYYKAYLDLLMTQEMRRILQRQRKRKLMVFVLMNS